MTKPISKSKRLLAQLLIEAGVTQFPEGANWAAQDRDDRTVYMHQCKPERSPSKGHYSHRTVFLGKCVPLQKTIHNWHQTVLSRDEFDQIVAADKLPKHDVNCRCVTRSIPEPTVTPTLDQLLQDWRNADDYAQRKHTEADEAAAMRDERWQAVQTRAGEVGVTVGRCEPVVAGDVQSVKIGDEIIAARVVNVERLEGRRGKVLEINSTAYHGPLLVKFPDDGVYWVKEWQLARP